MYCERCEIKQYTKIGVMTVNAFGKLRALLNIFIFHVVVMIFRFAEKTLVRDVRGWNLM